MSSDLYQVKSYRIPIEAPKDLIEDYFNIKQKALDAILSHVKITKKAHLSFGKEERRKLREELLKNWKFSKHYVDSAIDSVIGLVKGWVMLYNRGKAKRKPEITKKSVYVKSTLFSFRNGILKISVKPYERYLEIDLRKYEWVPKDFEKLGGLILTEKELIITVKKKVEPRADKFASFDVNLTNVTAFIDGKVKRYDLKPLYHVHRVYEAKRRKIQKLKPLKPKTSEKLMRKYSHREKNRARDFLHKLTTSIAKELHKIRSGAILEDLRRIKEKILNGSKENNRKLSKWDARTFQFMLEYKLKWLNLPVIYVNPANSSKTCPLCSGSMASYEGRSMKCERCGLILDRDVVAVLNLQMRGVSGSPREPSREGRAMYVYQGIHSPEPRRAAGEKGLTLFIASNVEQLYRIASTMGYGDKDYNRIYAFLEKIIGYAGI